VSYLLLKLSCLILTVFTVTARNSVIVTVTGWFNIPICSPWNSLFTTLYSVFT